MSYDFDTRLGRQLYDILPMVYRVRDQAAPDGNLAEGDASLARYLDSQGVLLDEIHALLRQQLDDALPDSAQEWLLPYFAQLLATEILSPDYAGKQAEVAQAINWRQRKGTLACAEQIAEQVGRTEVELQEGSKRLLMTAQVGAPLLPVQALDSSIQLGDRPPPAHMARHPGLPVATVDLRYGSRAISAAVENPATRSSRFNGELRHWRQLNRHGAPCFPDHFDDVSRRTVDLRLPAGNKGRYHHRRLLVYNSPPNGRFPLTPEITLTWSELFGANRRLLIDQHDESGIRVIRNNTRPHRRILITDAVRLKGHPHFRLVGFDFDASLTVEAGGRLDLDSVIVRELRVDGFDRNDALLNARDCLFEKLTVGNGIARLESCTVLGESYLVAVDISDSILAGVSDPKIIGVIRRSRVPQALLEPLTDRQCIDCISDAAVYFPGQLSLESRAVLHPDTPDSILRGAGGGGEMGYYHHRRDDRLVAMFCPTGSTWRWRLADGVSSAFEFNNLIFDCSVEVIDGAVAFRRCAIRKLIVRQALHPDEPDAVLDARHCIIDELEVPNGRARLEYCSLMKKTDCAWLQASDCLFVGEIPGPVDLHNFDGANPHFNCLRFSAIPAAIDTLVAKSLGVMKENGQWLLGSNTRVLPQFYADVFCQGGVSRNRPPQFGESGYAVLAIDAARSIRFGAEDGGEIGAYHDDYFSLKLEATLDKLREFLPVGIEPVMIRDARLLQTPPTG